MKIVCREHIDLSVSVERAFAFATDIARWPMWFGCMVNAHLPENQELELGAVLRLCMADGRQRRQESSKSRVTSATRFCRSRASFRRHAGSIFDSSSGVPLLAFPSWRAIRFSAG